MDWMISKIIGEAIVMASRGNKQTSLRKEAILVMSRNIFNDDMCATKERNSEYLFLEYPSFFRITLARQLWPKEMREQTVFYKYKDSHKKFLLRMSDIFHGAIDYINKNLGDNKIKFIVTANVDYYQDYPWIGAIHSMGGKFIALNKESVIRPHDEKELFDRLNSNNFSYEGDTIAVYNDLAKEVYIRSGRFDADKIYSIGCPRVDELLGMHIDQAKKGNFILLSSFMDPSYMATGLWNDVLKIIQNDELLRGKVVIKCKDSNEKKNLEKIFKNLRFEYGPLSPKSRRAIAIRRKEAPHPKYPEL